MTQSTPTAPEPEMIAEEAIAWFVRMHSDQRTLTDEDRFAQWLKQDSRHAQAYARIERVWRTAGPEITPRTLERQIAPHRNELGPPRRRWWIANIAAVLAVITIGTTYVILERARIDTGTFVTQAGMQRELKLADGSTITLNTRSEVTVDLREKERLIRLVRGEARFQVAKDASRPFFVDAGTARVRAVGTEFDVRVSDERIAVTLVEGRVEVTPMHLAAKMPEPAVLTAGQKLSLEVASGERRVEEVNLDRASAWVRQQLVFDSVPLTAAVEEANRYLQSPIVIEDPTLADIQVSGVVRAGNVESFVGSVESSFPVEVIRHADGQIALMRRSNDLQQ